MQREIKYRAWDVHRKKMVSPETLRGLFLKIQLLARVPYEFVCENGLYLPFSEDIYMRYTGLKDKNGKEIYEKDILQYWLEYDLKMHTAIVEWDNEYSMFILRTINEPDFKPKTGLGLVITEICGQKDVEVIGSIFDNPELLQEVI